MLPPYSYTCGHRGSDVSQLLAAAQSISTAGSRVLDL